MRIFTYRNRRRFRTTLLALAILLVLALVFLILRFAYLERYLVYTQKGAYFSYDTPLAAAPAPELPDPKPSIPVEIVYVTPEEAAEEEAVTPLNGVYISCSDLSDLPSVRAALDEVLAEPGKHTVLLELKNDSGRFYYSSALGLTAHVDLVGVDALIRSLREDPNVYLMASVPAFSDSGFALQNQPEGLPIYGGALWMDYDANYWLDPASDLVRTHLVAVLQELYGLGVQEVVFTRFYFPESQNIVYPLGEGETTSAIVNEAAEYVTKAVINSGLRVSFKTVDPAFRLPRDAARVALDGVDGSTAAAQAGQYTSDPLRVLFFTDSRDTRFADYCVLRPLLEGGDGE